MNRILFSLALLLTLLFFPWRAAAASDRAFDGQIIFGQSFVLESGKTHQGDLLVFGGTVEIQKDAVLNGNLVIFGGLLQLDGTVNGDVSITGGQVTLGPTAHITGDLITAGATLDKAEIARIDGAMYLTATSRRLDSTEATPTPGPAPTLPMPHSQLFTFGLDFLGNVFNAFLQAISLTLLTMVLMLFLAPQTARVAQAAVNEPWIAGLLGFLTVFLTPLALLLLIITLVLIPVAMIAAFLLVIAALFGWIALGYEIGERFTRAIHRTWHPSFSAGLGVFVLTLLSAVLTSIPGLNCISWVFPTVLSFLGLGAVIMTRFGMRAIPLEEPSQAPPTEAPTPEDG